MLPVAISREHEKAALKQARQAKDKETIERLEALVVEIDLPDELLLYYNAFLELDSERLFEGGPIPASAIRSWCSDYGLTFDQFDIMRVVIRSVDNAVLAARGKKGRNGNTASNRQDDGNGGNRRAIAGLGANQVRNAANG